MNETEADDGAVHRFWAWYFLRHSESPNSLRDLVRLKAAVAEFNAEEGT